MNLGRVSVIASREMLGIGVGSQGVDASASTQAPWPVWQFTGSGARLLVGPNSRVRPSVSSASMSIGPATMSLKVTWVPWWLPGVLFLVGAFAAYRLSRRAKPGHCPACNYDLTGLSPGTCPECNHRAGAV